MRATIAFLALMLLSSVAQAEKRIAFVVGIDKYDNLGPQQQLQRAVGDARAVGAALASVGFAVTAPEDVGRGAFNAEWQKFLDKLQPGDTVAIYFSGHGVEIEGLNFLLPRDVPNISFGRQEQLKRESLSISEMLLDLRKRKPQVTLVILDACRDNPLVPPQQRSLSWGRGLARMDAPAGTFIMYSAGAGESALDRLPGNDPDKVNSVYTRKLLPLVKTPGLPLHELARQLRLEVHDLAAAVPHVQQPAYYDGLIGKFCLAGCAGVAGAPVPKGIPTAPALKAIPTDVQTPTLCDGVEAIVGKERRCLKPGAGKTEWFKDCPSCPEMVAVPAGSFTMGSPEDEPERFERYEREDQVSVAIGKPFAVGRFAVTRGEFAAFVAATGHKTDGDSGCLGYSGSKWTLEASRSWRSLGFAQDDRHPVVCVNWTDAKAYVAWLASITGKSYRLLSETEREYVARAGTTTPFWWGSAITPAQANYNGEYTYAGGAQGKYRKATVPVDSFAANPWGLYNVHGNIWEWTEDCWNDKNAGNFGDGNARTPENCGSRVVRGGSWYASPKHLRSAFRLKFDHPDLRDHGIGFRVARTLD